MKKFVLVISATLTLFGALAVASQPTSPAIDTSILAQNCGLVPPATQIDNFSALNFENFAPIYAGSSSTEVDPNLSINTTTPINANGANLQYTASATIAQPRFIVSNAFYLGKAYTVATDLRIDAGFFEQSSTVETGLIGAIQSYSRSGGASTGTGPDFTSRLDTLRLQYTSSGSAAILSTNATFTQKGWSGGTNKTLAISGGLQAGTVYTLTMSYTGSGTVTATVVNKATAQTVAAFSSQATSTTASAIGMYVNTPAINESTLPTLNFSNVTVASSTPYQIAGNTYVRAPFPHFVVVNRYPDVPEFGGDWVGAPTGFYDSEAGVYKMWYRQRTAANRGIGYGYATSPDGVNWTKYNQGAYNNGYTIFVPTATANWQSVEKISIIKTTQASGGYLYQAWYSILPTSSDSNGWRVAYATSPDGINWTDKGIIDNSTYYKDPSVVRIPNASGTGATYYMYVLYGSVNGTEGVAAKVLTSTTNGTSWTIPSSSIWTNSDGHPSAFFAKNSGKWWVFQDNNPSMNYGTASLPSGPFTFTNVALSVSEVGLDDDDYANDDNEDSAGTGVNYAFFMTDENGQYASDQNILLYYQARHAYLNNPSVSWQDQQDGKIVLAGSFNGFYENLPVTVSTSSSSVVSKTYPAFPATCIATPGISSITPAKSNSFSVNVTTWNNTTGGSMSIINGSKATTASFSFVNLTPSAAYTFSNGSNSTTATSSSTGALTFSNFLVLANTATYTLVAATASN